MSKFIIIWGGGGGGGKCIIIVSSSSSSIKNVEGALNDLDLLKVFMRVSHIITVFMWSAMVLTIGYYTVQLHINQSASLCCFFSLVNLQCSNDSKCWCLQDLWSQVADNCVTGKEGKKYWHTQNSTRKFTQNPCQANTVAQKQTGVKLGWRALWISINDPYHCIQQTSWFLSESFRGSLSNNKIKQSISDFLINCQKAAT